MQGQGCRLHDTDWPCNTKNLSFGAYGGNVIYFIHLSVSPNGQWNFLHLEEAHAKAITSRNSIDVQQDVNILYRYTRIYFYNTGTHYTIEEISSKH
jgi:hypothetical protein